MFFRELLDRFQLQVFAMPAPPENLFDFLAEPATQRLLTIVDFNEIDGDHPDKIEVPHLLVGEGHPVDVHGERIALGIAV